MINPEDNKPNPWRETTKELGIFLLALAATLIAPLFSGVNFQWLMLTVVFLTVIGAGVLWWSNKR